MLSNHNLSAILPSITTQMPVKTKLKDIYEKIAKRLKKPNVILPLLAEVCDINTSIKVVTYASVTAAINKISFTKFPRSKYS